MFVQLFLSTIPGLKFLVRLCTDLGLKEVQDYATKLKKAEKAKELRDQVGKAEAHPLCSEFLQIYSPHYTSGFVNSFHPSNAF
jgi:hypothetical protein